MVGVCEICKSTDQSVLFNVPKNEKKRKSWSEACKIPLSATALICGLHFKSSDFVHAQKGDRLKRNAIPFVNINSPIKIKVEIDEVEEEADPLATVKVEYMEPHNLIHEEMFDEHNENSENNRSSTSANLNRTNETLTDSKYLTCGQIVVLLENESFKLHCKYCQEEFEIAQYQTFVKHIKETHGNVLKSRKPEINEDEASETILVTADIKMEVEDDQSKEIDESDDSFDADDDYKPSAKKAKLSKPNKKSSKKDEANLVTFETVPQKYVITFLELIKSNAILWHRRQSILKRFDETLTKLLAAFHDIYPKYQLTDESARISINRIKDLYRRVTDPKHKRHIKSSVHKTKFPEFFQHCDVIEENSKKVTYACDKCLAFFFEEIDLQIHKAKRHRIGELPFKCSRCGYGFAKVEKLVEHERQHERARDFVCEVCNRGFNSEEKLRAHSVTHSDDVKPVCEICGQKFSTYNKYRRHKLRHETPKEKCDICGKLFFEKWNLSEHIKSHLNERGYNCDICGKTFNHQNDVTIHKRGVHKIKPQKRRARWVNKDELTADDDDYADENENQQNESSDDSQNPYSDNYHYFRNM